MITTLAWSTAAAGFTTHRSACSCSGTDAGYADGPNQYAGFGNNPISLRDPTGEAAADYAEALHKSADEHLKRKEGLGGSATALLYKTVASALNVGTKLAEGVELLRNHGYGTAGFLDTMRGSSLITSDISTGAGLGASLYGAASFCRGATAFSAEWKRMDGWVQRVRPRAGPSSRAGEFLARKGFDSTTCEALTMTMKQHNASVALREIRAPQGRLRAMERDDLSGSKPIWLKENTEGGVVTYDGRTYVADVDVAEVFINGKVSTKLQRQKFLMDWNRNFVKLWRMGGRTGKPPVPVKHSVHLGMFDEIGSEVPSQRSLTGYRAIDARYIAETGHPGDCITVRLNGKGNLVAYQTPRAQIQRLVIERAESLRNAGMGDVVDEAFSLPMDERRPNNWNRFEAERNQAMEDFFGMDAWKKSYWER